MKKFIFILVPLLLIMCAHTAQAKSAEIMVEVNSVPELELSSFSIDNTGSNPLIIRGSLRNLGNTTLEVFPSVFIHQERVIYEEIKLYKMNLAWKGSGEFEAFIDSRDLIGGPADVKLIVKFITGQKEGVLTAEASVDVTKPEWEPVSDVSIITSQGISGFAGTNIEDEFEVWNPSHEAQEFFLFAKYRQDLFKSRRVPLNPKERRFVPVSVAIPVQSTEIEVVALNSSHASPGTKLALNRILTESELFAGFQYAILGQNLLLGLVLLCAIFVAYLHMRNSIRGALKAPQYPGRLRRPQREMANGNTGEPRQKNPPRPRGSP